MGTSPGSSDKVMVQGFVSFEREILLYDLLYDLLYKILEYPAHLSSYLIIDCNTPVTHSKYVIVNPLGHQAVVKMYHLDQEFRLCTHTSFRRN